MPQRPDAFDAFDDPQRLRGRRSTRARKVTPDPWSDESYTPWVSEPNEWDVGPGSGMSAVEVSDAVADALDVEQPVLRPAAPAAHHELPSVHAPIAQELGQPSVQEDYVQEVNLADQAWDHEPDMSAPSIVRYVPYVIVLVIAVAVTFIARSALSMSVMGTVAVAASTLGLCLHITHAIRSRL